MGRRLKKLASKVKKGLGMAEEPKPSPTDFLDRPGEIMRTDVSCTNCNKTFIAELDFRLEGNHYIVCPLCGHIHYRVIVGGKITEDRHNDRYVTHVAETRSVWKSEVLATKFQTSTVSAFLRDRWLNRSDNQQ